YKGRNIAGCGSVIRGNQGEWLGGFAKGVSNCSAFIAELWGVLEDLCAASRMSFTNVELSIDSQAVVQAIQTGRVQGSAGCAIIKKIQRVLE
ncbi:ribonuclease H protein, partial [Trifolium medium]|nr:ribonuclease H protein [Trifolium medium]